MGILEEHLPLVYRQAPDRATLSVGGLARCRASVDKRAGIARIVQDLCHEWIGKLLPNHLLVIGPAALMPWKEPALPVELAYYRKCRAGALKRGKHQLHTVPHVFVRINNDATAAS